MRSIRNQVRLFIPVNDATVRGPELVARNGFIIVVDTGLRPSVIVPG